VDKFFKTVFWVGFTIVVITGFNWIRTPPTIHFSEIEHGVTFSPPNPEQGKLFTANFYLRNNQQRSVIIEPFSYDFSHSYSNDPTSMAVVGGADVYPAIRLEVNETIILQSRTYVPRKSGTFTVNSFHRQYTIQIPEAWVPNNRIFFDKLDCKDMIIETAALEGLEYWNITIGEIEYDHRMIDGEYKLIRGFSANTIWRGHTVYWEHAGLITEDMEIQIIRLS
jgi:hypothetical protein